MLVNKNIRYVLKMYVFICPVLWGLIGIGRAKGPCVPSSGFGSCNSLRRQQGQWLVWL
jgi:hypothetical protein